MSFLKKIIAEAARKQNNVGGGTKITGREELERANDRGRGDFMSIGGIGGDDGVSGPREDIRPLQPPITRPPRRLLPPDNSVMADQGIGGYLNPRQIQQFINPPSPNNSAGQQNMKDLMQQQQDTFGARFVYPDPVTTPPYTPPPGGGGGGGGGIYVPPGEFPPGKFPPIDFPPIGGGGIGGGQFPPIFPPDIPPNFPPINPPIDIPKPPFDDPGLPPMVPPIGIPDDRPPFIDDRFDDIMERLKGIEDQYSSGIGGLQDRFDNLPVPVEPPKIDYDFLTKRIQDNIDMPPSIDRDMLMKDIMKNIDIPKPPSIDRNALIDEIRSGIDIPSFDMPDLSKFATLDDLNKGIGSINIPGYDDSAIRDLINKNTGAIGNIPSYDDSEIRDMIGKIPSFDPNQFATKGDLENRPIYDDSAIRDMINANAGSISNINMPDLSGYATIDDLNKGIGGVKMTGREELENALNRIPSYDDSAIRDLINTNAGAIASLPSMKLPVPTRATGMETLVSPQMFINRVPKGR